MSVPELFDALNGSQTTCYDCGNSSLTEEAPPPGAPPAVSTVEVCESCGQIINAIAEP